LEASAAQDAADFAMNHFYADFPAFGVMAPGAAKGAALEKHGCPDAWAVVNGVFFDVKNRTGYLTVVHLIFSFV
jgi:hypothetical protein